MTYPGLPAVLPFLDCLSSLKTTPRTGWLYHGIEHPESIADHMYRMGVLCMLCTDPKINKDHCVKMALVHDMAESIVGDITPHDNVTKEEKHRMESEAMEKIASQLIPKNYAANAQEIQALFQEYEAAETPEALFVKDVDKFEMIAQMFEYERKYAGEKNLEQFTWAINIVKHPQVRGWAEEVLAERKRFWEQLKTNTPAAASNESSKN
ncbi:metal dependent phosphohydrolase [Schizosaccharomyces japonicus yFS275]|uniref:5'-deoxynucleotidase n=1 Tax=Schizosaccharomyces japonicus (strain yFS275 / FY16936) TaxID=402676 RepID=B6JXC8_SCHJY|nr:metal dependent phosphohydrolase [Schizosaccharomyces japonicus yFS275]EEB06029.1 metal dependent phosphohydrolase [Schizosaccharomyces japonicus yFS275]